MLWGIYGLLFDLQKWKYLSCMSAVPVIFYQLNKHALFRLSPKYRFNNCVAGMKHAVTNYFASAVLCDHTLAR